MNAVCAATLGAKNMSINKKINSEEGKAIADTIVKRHMGDFMQYSKKTFVKNNR